MAKIRFPVPPEQHAQRLAELVEQFKAWQFPGLPRLRPEQVPDPGDMDLPSECKRIARYARSEALAFVKDPNVRGFGLGLRQVEGKNTDEYALVVLVRNARAAKLPAKATKDGGEFLIQAREFADPILPRLMATSLCQPFPRMTGGCSGSAVSNQVNTGNDICAVGTLTGTWHGLGSPRQRGLTCCHVALGFNITDFLQNLPASLLWLFESPAGEKIYASDQLQVGQDVYQLMEIDTPWWMLVPWPFGLLLGALAFVYVDGAAGHVHPQPVIPPPLVGGGFTFANPAPPPPPLKQSIIGATIGAARPALPGMSVYKVGQTTGVTWGNVVLSFLQLILPVPLGPFPIMIIFDQILSDLPIGTGDSGALLTEKSGDRALGCSAIGLPLGVRSASVGSPAALCGVSTQDIVPMTLSTPFYWHSLLMDINFA